MMFKRTHKFILIFSLMLVLLVVLFGCNDVDNKTKNILENNFTNIKTEINNSINQSEVTKMNTFNIKSSEFEDNKMIPDKFTCKGENINPNLFFEGMPEETKSLVLIMDDPDAPNKTWIHWILFNIKPDNATIEENSYNGIQGKNSWGHNNYGGPCPPSGTHRYFFKAYALDSILNLNEGASKEEVETAMKKHVIDNAKLIGLYKK